MRRIPQLSRASLVGLALSCVVLGIPSVASAAAGTQFNPGDLVVYEAQGTSSAAQQIDLVDYSTTGSLSAPSGFTMALPTTAGQGGAGNVPLVDSGSATNDGELNLSGDGTELIATGYDDAVGTPSITSVTAIPRTVAIVTQSGTVDTTTALTDSQTEGGATANNFRSATSLSSGSGIYVGGDGGLGITTDGSSSASYLNTGDTVHQVQVLDGSLFDSVENSLPGNINEVGSNVIGAAAPTSGTQTDYPLISGANLPAKFDPDQFAFVNLGTGNGPDTLYVADGAKGATSGDDNDVWKFSLENGVWTQTGSITTLYQPTGLVADVTTNAQGNKVANIYVTSATSTTAKFNSLLYGITDTSGYEGTLSATPTLLATAPSGDAFKGLAFAPGTSLPNNGDLPEAPFMILLPTAAVALFGGVYVVRRRRRHLSTPA